jgi:metallo-beta-lactamase family protein
MRINFHGAAQTVTGSQHLLEINGHRLLLDCGMYQGKRDETYNRNLNFAYDPRSVDAVILSHAHIDHSGNLPNLVKHGYEGPIYAVRATVDLATIMIADSGRIQESDAEFVNKKRLERGEAPIEPLYTEADAVHAAALFQGIDYGQAFEPVPGVTARFMEAGHILGSAAISLEIEEKGRTIRFWFSGDIGRYKLPLLRDPILPSEVDYLLMECTYGDKAHDDPTLAFDEFHEVVARTIKRGGKVIIPAFAVGRTQELVYHLNMMMYADHMTPVPVFVDSPLAVHASTVFSKHPECFDTETRWFVQQAHHPALDFKMLTYVQSVEESKALNQRKDPMIIISASGMAETGRILHHLKNTIENPLNTVCIVSWQAP